MCKIAMNIQKISLRYRNIVFYYKIKIAKKHQKNIKIFYTNLKFFFFNFSGNEIMFEILYILIVSFTKIKIIFFKYKFLI